MCYGSERFKRSRGHNVNSIKTRSTNILRPFFFCNHFWRKVSIQLMVGVHFCPSGPTGSAQKGQEGACIKQIKIWSQRLKFRSQQIEIWKVFLLLYLLNYSRQEDTVAFSKSRPTRSYKLNSVSANFGTKDGSVQTGLAYVSKHLEIFQEQFSLCLQPLPLQNQDQNSTCFHSTIKYKKSYPYCLSPTHSHPSQPGQQECVLAIEAKCIFFFSKVRHAGMHNICR